MPTDANLSDDDNGTAATPSAAARANADETTGTTASSTPTWWETINPAYMPEGAWTPQGRSALHLTAPASSGWMPPPSSFSSLAHGSSLPTAGAEPGEAMKAAAAAAAAVAGDAIEAAQSTADVTLASAQSTAEEARAAAPASAAQPVTLSSYRDALAQDGHAGADALIDAERRRVHDVLTQVSGSLGTRAKTTTDSLRQAGGPGFGNSGTVGPTGPAVLPAQGAVGAVGAARPYDAVRPYDPSAIRSAVTGAVSDATSPYRDTATRMNGRVAGARNTIAEATSPARQASIRRQSAIAGGLAIAFGALMAFFILFLDFDAGPDQTAVFAGGIVLTVVAQLLLFIWAITLVVRWRVAAVPKTGWRPGRAIWITLLLSPVPLVVVRALVESM